MKFSYVNIGLMLVGSVLLLSRVCYCWFSFFDVDSRPYLSNGRLLVQVLVCLFVCL